MRRILYYIVSFVVLCFLIPIIFAPKSNEKQAISRGSNMNEEVKNNNEKSKLKETSSKELSENQDIDFEYDYKEYSSIKLLHTKTGIIEEIPLDKYIYGVVSAEMPASFEVEALKAQAIVARTYTIYKIKNNSQKHENANICDDSTCCQAWISKEDRLSKWVKENSEEYWNKIVEAVDSTKGKIITYEKEPINAFFHSNSGGKTETTLNVWGGNSYPYLQTVATSGEDAYSQYSSEVTLTKQDFINKIKEKHSNFTIDFNDKSCIKILEYTEGGRVKNIKIGNLELSGVEVRTLLGLKSANFTIHIEENTVKFEVVGYGHGVGMSQTGADSMAKQGSTYEEIIKHFYTGVEIENL